MNNHFQIGLELRNKIKELVFDFIKNNPECTPNSQGIRQTVIFRECGMDWGNKEKATSTNQQYWVIAALRQLEEEGLIIQNRENHCWTMI